MSAFRGTVDVMASASSSSQEQLLRFAPDASQKICSGSVHEGRMLAPNGAASRPSSVVQDIAIVNSAPRLISRRLSTYVPHVSSYDPQSSPATTQRSGPLRNYSVIENHITRPSTAVPYPGAREDSNHDPARMRSQVPSQQFFQANTRLSPVSRENVSMPQSSQERPLLGTLEAYQFHRIGYNPSQETSTSAQFVDESFHHSAISGTTSNKTDYSQLKGQSRTTLGDSSLDQEGFGWSAASSASAVLDHQLSATAYSIWESIAPSQPKDTKLSLYRGHHPEGSSRDLNMSGEDPSSLRTSLGHFVPPTGPSHPPTGPVPSEPKTIDSLTCLSPQNHDGPSEKKMKTSTSNGQSNGNGTVKEGDTSRPLTNETTDARAANATNKRPASRQARPQSKAKRPRKANQGAQVYRTKPSRPPTRASTKSKAVLAGDMQKEAGFRTLDGSQLPSTAVAVGSEVQSPTRVDSTSGQRALTPAQPATVPTLPPDIQRAAQDSLQPEAESGRTGKGSRLSAGSACMRCRRKKQECNGFRPTCESCTKSGVSVCVYPDDVSKAIHGQCFRRGNPEPAVRDEDAGMPADDATDSQSHLQHAKHAEEVREPGSPTVATVDSGTSTYSEMTDTCAQTDGPKRLQMDLLEWRRLVERGMALEAAHLSEAIVILKESSDSPLDEQAKLLRAAQHGGQFVRDLLNLFRCQVTVS